MGCDVYLLICWDTDAAEEECFEVVKSMKETGYLEHLKYLSGAREEDVYAEEAKAA